MSHIETINHCHFNFLTWYEVWYLSSDIPLRISMNMPLAEQVDLLTHELC